MFRQWFDLTMLALESQQVIALRMLRLAGGGGAAQREAERMVSEKIVAAASANARLMAGASPNSVVRSYRKKVRANARRLKR